MLKELKKLSKENDGFIKTKDVVSAGIRKEKLKELVDSGLIVREKRGVYSFTDTLVDEYYLLQLKAPILIYSLGSALYFFGYSNRVPNILSITVPQGYNIHRITNERLRVRYSNLALFEIGLTSVVSPQGKEVRCYDLERTICDIIKERDKLDSQIFSDAINQYFSNKKINVSKLLKYARLLDIEEEVIKYFEILRWKVLSN